MTDAGRFKKPYTNPDGSEPEIPWSPELLEKKEEPKEKEEPAPAPKKPEPVVQPPIAPAKPDVGQKMSKPKNIDKKIEHERNKVRMLEKKEAQHRADDERRAKEREAWRVREEELES